MKMYTDIDSYLDAAIRDIPSLHNWQIKEFRSEFFITAEDIYGEKVSGKIVSQHKNCVTLEDGRTYFVFWNEIDSSNPSLYIMMLSIHTSIREFEEFAECGFECRPVLFKKK